MNNFLFPADIYLPDFNKVDGKKWASVACDQFTSEPEYWYRAYDYSADSPTTLSLMLPEAFLENSDEKITQINKTMDKYLKDVLVCHPESMIYLERIQSDGKLRRGIIGAVDLEMYDYNKGSSSAIRATEGTVLERIPPRVNIRRNASLEMPHIMMLIDDPYKTVIEPVSLMKSNFKKAYDFDLFDGGGHVRGYFIDKETFSSINEALTELSSAQEMKNKYDVDCVPLLFAIGDGNHSLAGAKALYEEIKGAIGNDAAINHPSRYALCEVVNLHDDALEFEPIYRVIFGADPENFLSEFERYSNNICGNVNKTQNITCLVGNKRINIAFDHPQCNLSVGSVQNFLDYYISMHKNVKIDYIHGTDSVEKIVNETGAIGILFDGMTKDSLFKTVICEGALPRKTFSMGHAKDKRYYIECRKIK